jgi:tellurite resistance protein TerC
MIYFGVLIINHFAWTTYLFELFLIYTAIKMLLNGDEDQFEPKKSFVYKSLRKIMPISNHIDGEHFYQKKTYNRRNASFVALIVIEVMDVIFAVIAYQPF